jgi:Viral alkaline exonuclease
MPVLSNPRHEKFAQLLVQGRTEYEAYEACHYKPNRGNPCKLARNPLIVERVKELTQEAAKRTIFDKEKLIEMHNRIFNQGMSSGQLAPAGTAVKEISVLTGHRIERQEVGGPGEYEAMGDDELERQIMERVQLFERGSDTQH